MENKISNDICTESDIIRLLDEFYTTVRADKFIGPVFNSAIADAWPAHMSRMYAFWQTILLGKQTYTGSPFLPHTLLQIDEQHFNQWLQLWYCTLDKFYSGPVTEEAKWRAGKMAIMLQSKLAHYKNGKPKPLM